MISLAPMLPISPLAQPTAASSRLMPPPPTNTDFYAMVQERTLFTKLLLVKQGQCQLQLHADTNAEIQHLSAHHLLLVTPQEIATLVDVSPYFEAECCLVDELIAKQPGCYQLPDEKYQSVLDIVSSLYLMRLVRDISGSTVNEHVTSLLYKEICNLLSHSDMTIGEIATHLNFSDQSALTNFFKQRSGMTPLAYRNKKVKR